MAMLTVRNLPDDVHRALRVRAAQHGHSTEAEVREILENAVKPETRVRLGDALAALGREIGLTNEDFDAFDGVKDKRLAELLFGIAALPAGKRKDMLACALDGLLGLFRDRMLPFDTDAARCYADLAAMAKAGGRGFPTPDGYIAAIAASRGFIVASRDTAPYAAAGVTVINPWNV